MKKTGKGSKEKEKEKGKEKEGDKEKEEGFKAMLSCLILPKITGNLPSLPLDQALFPSELPLADPSFGETGPIDMLIGAEIFWELLCIGQFKLGPEQPTIQKTQLGWVITGPLSRQLIPELPKTSCHLVTNQQLNEDIAKFEGCEETHSTLAINERNRCEQHFGSSTTRNSEGRFVVRIPFKEDTRKLGEYRLIAEKRLLSLERQLSRNKELRDQYVAFLDEY
ncbi:uncharacterized protein LOC112904620 [Agrilus planipennis]|uniref:Uncharacterized protein LOC112904620 n=1 Tax=Agrilus planipennis TaxID=224129 RepID=A0A7F5QZX2_AGRPL|nr:uncharacterized protein LOC112904620 [Agrilus planipennis]